MVIPVGLPNAQHLVVGQKDLSGRITVREIMPVLFSQLEGSDEPAFRASLTIDRLDFRAGGIVQRFSVAVLDKSVHLLKQG